MKGEVEDRLKKGVMKLQPHEWKAGDNLWLINTIDPFGKAEDALRAFASAEDGAAGKEFRFLSSNPDGQRVIVTTSAEKMGKV